MDDLNKAVVLELRDPAVERSAGEGEEGVLECLDMRIGRESSRACVLSRRGVRWQGRVSAADSFDATTEVHD